MTNAIRKGTLVLLEKIVPLLGFVHYLLLNIMMDSASSNYRGSRILLALICRRPMGATMLTSYLVKPGHALIWLGTNYC